MTQEKGALKTVEISEREIRILIAAEVYRQCEKQHAVMTDQRRVGGDSRVTLIAMNRAKADLLAVIEDAHDGSMPT